MRKDPSSGAAKRAQRMESRAEAARDPAATRELLGRYLRPAEDRRVEVVAFRVGPARSREGYRYAVRYDLSVKDETGLARDEVVTGVNYGGGRTRRVWDAIQAETSPEPFGPSPLRPFSYVPELDMLLQVFPHDHRLPALARLLAGPPPELEPALLASFGGDGWRTEAWEAESIRYRVDQRATLRIALRAGHDATGRQERRTFFAKVYRDDDEANRADAALRELATKAAAAGARFLVPEPVAFAPALRTLVQSEALGTPLLRIVRRGADALPAVRLAAAAIADFHRLDLDPAVLAGDPPPRSLPDRLARLDRAAALLRSLRPDLAAEVDRTVAAIVGGLAEPPAAPTHGDLKPDHLLVAGDRVALIDFDLLRASDPMLDVANFGTHLDRAEGQGNAPAGGPPASRVFVEEYLRHAPLAWGRRLRFYDAMERIGSAARTDRDGAGIAPDRVPDLLRDARDAVEGTVSG